MLFRSKDFQKKDSVKEDLATSLPDVFNLLLLISLLFYQTPSLNRLAMSDIMPISSLPDSASFLILYFPMFYPLHHLFL